jgi:multiple sugar transport system permease protein/putative aldouronate transport system permease protein
VSSTRPARIRETTGDRIYLIVVYGILAVILVAILYPLVYVVSASFSSPNAVAGGRVWLWPVDPGTIGYKLVFENNLIVTGFLNSLFYTLVGGLFSTVLTVMMAYPISRKYFIGRSVLIWLLLFAFVFNGGLIPFYLVVKDLGLLDTRWALILPTALGIFQVFLAKTFFQTSVSSELYDSARIDGCSELQFLLRVVLPTSGAILAVLFLLYAVGQWNSYFNALIFLSDQGLYPLQLVLRNFLIVGQTGMTATSASLEQYQRVLAEETLLRYAVIVVATVPMLILYPFAQRYFTKGVMLGSLKE